MTAAIDSARRDLSFRASDSTPVLFTALSDDRDVWLRRVFPSSSELVPVLIACQQMAGHVEVFDPPVEFTSEFHIARIGDTTFDLEVRLLDNRNRVLARASNVISVMNCSTRQSAQIPTWLQRTLRKKVQHG